MLQNRHLFTCKAKNAKCNLVLRANMLKKIHILKMCDITRVLDFDEIKTFVIENNLSERREIRIMFVAMNAQALQ